VNFGIVEQTRCKGEYLRPAVPVKCLESVVLPTVLEVHHQLYHPLKDLVGYTHHKPRVGQEVSGQPSWEKPAEYPRTPSCANIHLQDGKQCSSNKAFCKT